MIRQVPRLLLCTLVAACSLDWSLRPGVDSGASPVAGLDASGAADSGMHVDTPGADGAPAAIPDSSTDAHAHEEAGTEPCPTNMLRCGDACVLVADDPNHCGRCERTCKSAVCG